ncbi:phage tail protein [Lelliottia amnigena]|uniref:phage tail protein n=1 Tax=Lelliottia amnigena TaxID=61646 RepID=UPI0020906B4F|nr:phage tail protein [Lelliottia amnigena]USR61626.1 phage tail protein [Lelliottia amnigena]
MADNSLNQPVIVRAVSLNASSIPSGLSPAYSQYILSQATDFTNVAGKANEAGQGAYDAQIKNDEQDVTLADHDARITANTGAINLLEVRLTTAEGKIVVLRSDVDYLLGEVISIQAELVTVGVDIDNLQSDYVSKSTTTPQSLASALSVATSYSVSGTKVVGARQSGWTAGTGTALLGAFNANQSFTVSNPPTQAEVQAIAAALVAVRQRNLALEQMARTHGLIN